MTSGDGIVWTAKTAAEANGWGSLTYGNGEFVAMARNDVTHQVMTPDSH